MFCIHIRYTNLATINNICNIYNGFCKIVIKKKDKTN